ncbi:MAG: hypothetical protein M1827_005189 [Pycnora praestabilis]|nr:MAG: hypothetical protein M1827_005189 [Pycnora praestabilis]
MVHRQTFFADYEHFWSLVGSDRDAVDGALIALIFVMLAMGTQFVSLPSVKERAQTAEFYSFKDVIIYDNHASDSWAFAGVLIRQAYAMGLNRDPDVIIPHASHFEKQQRRKLWQAVLLQDTFLTVILKLPPTATHTDVNVEDLHEDPETSIGSSHHSDIAFVRAMWALANLVQETLCSPRSLDLPISSSPRHKTKLVSDFRSVYRSFPDMFRSWNETTICEIATRDKRMVRQTLFLTSNYFHCLMLLHSEDSDEVPINVRGTLEAAHDAINSFFLLHTLFASEAVVWWVFQHRAFSEALVIATLVKDETEATSDPLYVRAKADVVRMIEILQLDCAHSSVAQTRVSVLSNYL